MPTVKEAAARKATPSEALDFAWTDPPPPGEVVEIAPGLLWARLPLPFRLNHVNVWLLREEGGWTVIDTGCATPEILEIWEKLLAGPMGGLPVKRVIATHGHVDHIGLTGWMVERFESAFVGTFAEWMWARVSHTHEMPRARSTHSDYLVRHGFNHADAEQLVANRSEFINLSTPLPGSICEIRDGDTIRFGGRDWSVIVTGGHSFEHASFLDADNGILIAGDHLLPSISPVIAVYEMAPDADPLGDYLASFSKFDGVDDDVLVLPSHGMPYRGIRKRIGQLEMHHRERLDVVVDYLRMPRSALELSRKMFPRVEGVANIGFALGEALAHINFLVRQGTVTKTSDAGATIFRTSG